MDKVEITKFENNNFQVWINGHNLNYTTPDNISNAIKLLNECLKIIESKL